MMSSFHAPPCITPAQWFEIQPINMTHHHRSNARQVINSYTGQCRNQNTLLHTFVSVVNVCKTINTSHLTLNRNNCHNSSVQVSFCDNRSSQNNTTCQVVPVHWMRAAKLWVSTFCQAHQLTPQSLPRLQATVHPGDQHQSSSHQPSSPFKLC